MITAQDGTQFYTRQDLVDIFKMGDKASLELFHDPDFPAQKFRKMLAS